MECHAHKEYLHLQRAHLRGGCWAGTFPGELTARASSTQVKGANAKLHRFIPKCM